MRRILSGFLLFVFLLASISAQQNVLVVSEQGSQNIKAETSKKHMVDVRTRLQNETKEIVAKARAKDPTAFTGKKLHKTQAWDFQVGTQHTFWARDFRKTDSNAEGYFYEVQATCRAVSDYCYVFIEDAVWDDGSGANSDAHANQNSADVISNAFSYSTPADQNKGIYHIDTEVFGYPFNVDNDDRIIILILDIKDNYDGVTNFSYTGGYNHVYNSYAADENAPYSNEMEMFYQDAYPADALTENGLLDVCATVAHEFQHMIEDGSHWMVNGIDQETFFDEGCSETASVVCGYPGRSSNYYNDEANLKLITWRDGDAVLGDYERAFRFILYMYEQFGSDFLTKFISAQNDMDTPLISFDAFDKALTQLNTPTSRRRADIIWDWHLASAVENTSVDPKWGFNESVIRQITGKEYSEPNASADADSVQAGGAKFLTFKNGSNITAHFSFESQYAPNFLKIFAVKGEGASTQVEEVATDVDVNFADFGSTYTKLTFVISSSSKNSPFTVSYTITGEGGTPSGPQELSYEQDEPLGILTGELGDKMAVSFNGVPNTILKTIKVALRRDGNIFARVHKYTDSVSDPLGDALSSSIEVNGLTTPDVPYPVPWTNWVEIDMESENISTAEAFIICFSHTGNNDVMVTSAPGQYFQHSHSYDMTDRNWKYYVNSTDDVTYLYMIRAVVQSPTGTEEIELLPTDYALNQNYPNPFNPTTNITYSIPESGNVKLTVYNVLGKEIVTLVNDNMNSGTYKTTWDGKDSFGNKVSSGIYFYTIQSDNFVQTRKMVLLK